VTVLWEQAGRAWGARARDWAYLTEPYGRPAYDLVFARTGVGQQTSLLDIACGSGLALMAAARRGATVAGLDASEQLVRIARQRTPRGDIRHGDMFALPFPDGAFDVVTSFNGIWAGCEQALLEARRVVRPGGFVAITFWGKPRNMQMTGCFQALAKTAPPSEVGELASLAQIGRPGVAEAMLERAGLAPVERGTVESVSEWPDTELAWRAIAAIGPAWSSIEYSGEAAVKAEVLSALAPFSTADAGVRLMSELAYVIARAAGTAAHSALGRGEQP
jgi:ubiquinone/menaquinone biosynthesis C-methylase UbiE